MRFTLRDVKDAVKGEAHILQECLENRISGAVIDSRLVKKDSVFLATVGEKVDAHKFIGQVFEKGAALVITEKTPEEVEKLYGVDKSLWGNFILVKDAFISLKEIAKSYRETLNIPVVGITGSVGKTSTKEFIAGVLSAKYNVLKTEGNFNNEIGVPLTLMRITEDTEVAVVEMGISDFEEMHRLSSMVKPDIAVITNIGNCHLENLGDRDGVLRAKTEIFDNMPKTGTVILNGDDDKLITVDKNRTPGGRKPLFFGLFPGEEKAAFADNIISKKLFGSEASINIGDEKLQAHIPMPGIHMVINATAAALVGKELGLNNEEILRGISSIKPLPGRNNIIKCSDYVLIDDCYNANPASMKSSLDLLMMADTFKTAILGDMFELGENSDNLHREVGEYAASTELDRLICVGKNSINMYNGAKKINPAMDVRYYEEVGKLVDDIKTGRKSIIPDGATVLVKASHGMKFTENLVELLK
ncbi:MAG: UDP-N-acetylmuramoyl-tripeptide--D-alanyl-D-alanine ligase [Lachnospiraceae bacterium]|nr:UDP-N-acetylmuramoyl-tripeptide--D-alanyl-D-alanine ligase [Lachnospiraceae bacterium]